MILPIIMIIALGGALLGAFHAGRIYEATRLKFIQHQEQQEMMKSILEVNEAIITKYQDGKILAWIDDPNAKKREFE